MGYRIMQLHYLPMKKEAIIEQGVLLKRPNYLANFKFVEILSSYQPQDSDLRLKVVHDYEVENEKDGFKNLKLYISRDEKVKEDGILLIIPYFKKMVYEHDSGIKKIAGRYPGEGIFVLKPNNKITLIDGDIKEEFVALQFEGEMYLLKLHEK